MNKNFKDIIEHLHIRCWAKTKKKLYNKLVRSRTTWAKQNNCNPEDIENFIMSSLGKKCIYCNEVLDVKNMSLDHDTPLGRDGELSLTNLKIICKRCNCRKGIMRRLEYKALLEFILTLPEEARKYVLRKLSSRDMWGK
ncbi:MAG: HNH endonuclease [Patescibacteria group bacterium]|jgi:5-methylcytosine-specific restriction endonuclease McrA|nr:HNH endonuclease [Patescibacteria group bacterium]